MRVSFLRGVRLFDSGNFFEAHEAWEERWLVSSDEREREFLQGLIQIAAGFHKLVEKHSRESASRLLAKGLSKLDACPEQVTETSLASFCDRVRAYGRAIDSGSEGQAIPRFDLSLD